MNAQQMHDIVIKPTLERMSKYGHYNTINARMLMLGTLAIESDMGLYNQQNGGPAISPFQLEPPTIISIAQNWDAWPDMIHIANAISMLGKIDSKDRLVHECEVNMRLACMMARGKYAMDKYRLPGFDDKEGLYEYYKRVYNTAGGASTYYKWCEAWNRHNLDEVEL